METFLNGYTSQENAFEVTDYPYGFRLRTSIFYWIESKAGHGDRLCTYTIDPRNGRKNKPKCGTYCTFLYLYKDENGHVKADGFDSYDIEYFKMRFGFILNKIGIYLTDVQKQNIRVNHYQHVKMSAPYWAVKYSDEMKQHFIEWAKETLLHIRTCPFENLVDYPEAPEQDKPEGEVKMTITTYQTT